MIGEHQEIQSGLLPDRSNLLDRSASVRLGGVDMDYANIFIPVRQFVLSALELLSYIHIFFVNLSGTLIKMINPTIINRIKTPTANLY